MGDIALDELIQELEHGEAGVDGAAVLPTGQLSIGEIIGPGRTEIWGADRQRLAIDGVGLHVCIYVHVVTLRRNTPREVIIRRIESDRDVPAVITDRRVRWVVFGRVHQRTEDRSAVV